jgi:hypothetical protein
LKCRKNHETHEQHEKIEPDQVCLGDYRSSNKSMATKRHRRRKNGEDPTIEFPDFCDFLCLLVARKMAAEFLNPL